MTQTNRDLWEALFDGPRSRAALVELRKRANANDADAQWHLASWLTYHPRRGYMSTTSPAARWLLRAADLGHVASMVEAAQFLETHAKSKADVERANRLYRTALRRGSPLAAWALGINEERSFAEDADLRKAYSWFKRAATLDASLGWKVGEYALAGIVKGAEAVEALHLLRKSAKAGNCPEAEFYLGLRSYLGLGCSKNSIDSKRWFARAAANRFATTTELGDRYAHALLGRQLGFSSRSRLRGIRHLEIAAGAGLPLAQVDLALARLAAGGQWRDAIRQLRSAAQNYLGNWREPGTAWLGVELITLERIILAHELMGMGRYDRGVLRTVHALNFVDRMT